MDPTKEANQNLNQNDDVDYSKGLVASEVTLHENGENPYQNDIASTTNPPPAERTNIIDLNTVYIDLDANDDNSELVEEASDANERPEVTESMTDYVEQPPQSTELNWDGAKQISNSDFDRKQTDDDQDRPKTYNFFRTEADNSPAHCPCGILPFMPSGHDTGKSSSAGAKKRKFTDGLVKQEEEEEEDFT